MHHLVRIVGHHLLVQHFDRDLEVLIVPVASSEYFSVLAEAQYFGLLIYQVVLLKLSDALLPASFQSGEPTDAGTRLGNAEGVRGRECCYCFRFHRDQTLVTLVPH